MKITDVPAMPFCTPKVRTPTTATQTRMRGMSTPGTNSKPRWALSAPIDWV